MARTPEQRGPFGRCLVGERRARGWSADEMRARVQEARGFAMAHSTYALLESGQRQPTDEQRRHLTAFLGSEPAAEAPTPTPDLAALLAAMTRQTDVVTDLLAALHAEKLERLALQVRLSEIEGQLRDLAAARREDAAQEPRSAATTPAARGVRPRAAADAEGRS